LSTVTDKANYVGPANVPDTFWQADLESVKSTGADPYLMAAIAQHETDFGTLGAGTEGYTLGYGYPGPGQGDPTYLGVTKQLFYAGLQSAGFFKGQPVTEQGLKDFQAQSWKAGDPAWYKGVWSIYQGMTGGTPIVPTDGTLGHIGGGPLGAVGTVVDTLSQPNILVGKVVYVGVMAGIVGLGIFFFVKIWK
jgi:hypothetical protein